MGGTLLQTASVIKYINFPKQCISLVRFLCLGGGAGVGDISVNHVSVVLVQR